MANTNEYMRNYMRKYRKTNVAKKMKEDPEFAEDQRKKNRIRVQRYRQNVDKLPQEQQDAIKKRDNLSSKRSNCRSYIKCNASLAEIDELRKMLDVREKQLKSKNAK